MTLGGGRGGPAGSEGALGKSNSSHKAGVGNGIATSIIFTWSGGEASVGNGVLRSF